MNQVQINHLGTDLTLLKERALYLVQTKVLLLSDLHFGKAAHFRKSGIPIPEPIHDKDLEVMNNLFSTYLPEQVYFLGDLFHSDWNNQWEILNQFLSQFQEINFHLVQGNHDILSSRYYQSSALKFHKNPVKHLNLIFSHEPLREVEEGFLNICGHIHPGVLLRGLARQSLRIPCFYWDEQQLILPAFGNFTGLALMQKTSTSKIFGLTSKKVIPILS